VDSRGLLAFGLVAIPLEIAKPGVPLRWLGWFVERSNNVIDPGT
jgi:hypothetical protein